MIIYLAGPIRPKGKQTLERNISYAKGIALELWKEGYVVISPHANSDLPISMADKEVGPIKWIEGDTQIIARMDAIVVLPEWEESEGTKKEIAFARERCIPVYYYPSLPPLNMVEKLRPKQAGGFIDIVMKMYRVHLEKNSDYSPANILGTGEIGLVTRVWDKIARLMNLFGFRINIGGSEFVKPELPKNESVDDNLMDLAVYAIIWQLLRKGIWGK
jgi:hypothetical protein